MDFKEIISGMSMEDINLTEKMAEDLHQLQRTPAFLVLALTTAALWCHTEKFRTITEALDGWRGFSEDIIEPLIRDAFPTVRYGGDEEEEEKKQ